MKRILIAFSVGSISLLALTVAGQYYFSPMTPEVRAIDASNTVLVEVGQAVYTGHCAVCHGENLEGQPNWRSALPTGGVPAPPHNESGHTWHHSDDVLFRYTKFGGQALVPATVKSNMPGFSDQLSDNQIWAVLSYIKSRWPKNIQRRQSALNRQSRYAE